jgi:hypothetical protein
VVGLEDEVADRQHQAVAADDDARAGTSGPRVAIERASSSGADLDADRRAPARASAALRSSEPRQHGVGGPANVGRGFGPCRLSPPRQAASESVKASAGRRQREAAASAGRTARSWRPSLGSDRF